MEKPTKEELCRLQEIHKTDTNIAQGLGVPTKLVRQWREFYGISKHKRWKYSKKKIQELWDKYKDDELAGRELGMSKQVFSQWRYRHNIYLKKDNNELDERVKRNLEIINAKLKNQAIDEDW